MSRKFLKLSDDVYENMDTGEMILRTSSNTFQNKSTGDHIVKTFDDIYSNTTAGRTNLLISKSGDDVYIFSGYNQH